MSAWQRSAIGSSFQLIERTSGRSVRSSGSVLRALGGELIRESLGSDLKNCIWVDGTPGYLAPTAATARGSRSISVLDGDYFECQVWRNSGADQDVEADPKTWFGIVAIEFAAFRGALVRLTATEPVAASTEVAIPWNAIVYATDTFWSANPTRLTAPPASRNSASRATSTGPSAARATATSGAQKRGPVLRRRQGERSWRHGVQSIGAAVVDLMPGDYFELIARPDLRRNQERRGRRAHPVRYRRRGMREPASRSSARSAPPGTTP